jgi:hypothetical protein
MLKTYIWMAVILGINWGGFMAFLIRASRQEVAKAKGRKNVG